MRIDLSSSLIWSRPGMRRMFTRREGIARCSFIMSTMSIPPALNAEPLIVSWIASWTEVASAHSKDCMALRSLLCVRVILLGQRRQNDRGRHRDLPDAHADRVVDGVGDRAGGGHSRGLADAGGVGRAA